MLLNFPLKEDCNTFKADSHIACRAHAASIPFPSHGVPLKFRMCLSHLIYTVRPCLIHTCHTMPMPCYAHAMLRPCRSSQGHGTARQSGDGLWVPARFRLLPANARSSTKVVIRRIPVSDAGGQCETKHRLSWTRKRVLAAHYKKDDLLHCWTRSSDIFGYHAAFHEGHGTIGAGQGRGMTCVN